jgi:hypothetical protein
MFGAAERLTLRWAGANTIACTIIGACALPLSGFPDPMVAGAIVGTAQWLALRSGLRLSPAWIPVTAAAWAVGCWASIARTWTGPVATLTVDSLVDALFFALSMKGLSIGIAVGIAQCCLLWRRVRWWFAWFPATAMAIALGWKAGFWAGMAARFEPFCVGGAVFGLVSTALPVPLLLWMLRHLKVRTPVPQSLEQPAAVGSRTSEEQ